MRQLLQKPYILLLVIALGALAAGLMLKNRAPVSHQPDAMPARTVDVIELHQQPFRARVSAYGNVEPAIAFIGRAELGGKLTYLHPQLKQGGSIQAHTVVARIEPDDVLVALRQSEADLQASRSALTQLEEEEKTAQRALQLARRNLAVGEQELARIRDIWAKKLIARSALDAEEQKVLQLRQSVSDLQGSLNTFASRISSENARIRRAEEQVKGQQTALGRTEIRVPFDARIGEVSVEQGEFVTAGSQLFEALNVDGVEIDAQVPVQQMRGLVMPLRERLSGFSGADLGRMLASLELSARVSLVGELPDAVWQGRVLRFGEAIDPVRRTLSIVVGVDNPYGQVVPGRRPPLIKGMYTQVEVFAPAQPAWVIPYRALHEGRVYLAGADDRLEVRPVKLLASYGELAVIEQGLEDGDRLIVNDLVPVIPGMALSVRRDMDAEAELQRQASGAGQ